MNIDYFVMFCCVVVSRRMLKFWILHLRTFCLVELTGLGLGCGLNGLTISLVARVALSKLMLLQHWRKLKTLLSHCRGNCLLDAHSTITRVVVYTCSETDDALKHVFSPCIYATTRCVLLCVLCTDVRLLWQINTILPRITDICYCL